MSLTDNDQENMYLFEGENYKKKNKVEAVETQFI